MKREINELTYEKKYDFLKKTICYKIFKQLRRNPKLIKNFRYILKNIIKEVYIYSQTRNNEIYDLILTNKIYLSIPMIEEKINEKINEEKKIKEKNKVKNINNKKYKNQIKNKIINPEEITKKYFQNITKSFLEEKIEEYKNDNSLKEFCQFQLNSFNSFVNDEDKNELFTNNNLFKRLSSSQIKEVEEIYKRNLSLVIYFLNKFLNILSSKINEIPFQIRQICKLIKIFVIEKFPEIKKFELNTMIGIFFFENILFPFLTNPQINSLLMTTKNLSEDLFYNLSSIVRYIKCFFYGYFYFEYNEECDYTPFNSFFLQKLPSLDFIIGKICDVEIPNYIQKLIIEKEDDTISNEINFNNLYNEKYDIYHQTICLSFGELSFIMKTISIYKDNLFENGNNSYLNKIWEKIYKHKLYKDIIVGKAVKENTISKNITQKIKKNKNNPIDKDTKQIFEFINNINNKPKITKEYFIINNTIFNINEKDYNEKLLLNNKFLNYKINNKDLDIFAILKKSFCDIINNLPSFNELISSIIINENNIKNFNTFISEIKKYFEYHYFNHMNFEQLTKNIELKWALNFFIENKNNILNGLNNNNSLLFFGDLENDLKNSIENINNNIVVASHFYDNNINFVKNHQISYFILSKLKEINSNLIVQKIIEKYSSYIQVSVKASKAKNKNSKNIWSELIFEIKKGKEKDDKWYDINSVYMSEKNNYTNYKTIKSFIDNFTFENEFFNMGKINEHLEETNNNIFDYLYKLKIPEKINTYLDTSIKELLLEKIYHNLYSKQDIPNIVLKIKKIILCSLYDNIFRNYVPNLEDNLIYKKSIMLSWTNLSHFTNESLALHKSLISSIVECFLKLEKKKISKEKLLYLIKINDILSSIHCEKEISFNNKKLNDSFHLNPILIYSIIKSKPHNLSSDIRFIEIFIDDKDKNIKLIEIIKVHISFIIDITHKDLYGNISEEYYNKQCSKCLNE